MQDPLTTHRSIRRYRDTPVSAERLAELVATASRGSNTGNMQLYSVVLTTDAGLRERLCEAHLGQPMVRQAPVVATVCADVARFNAWASLSGAAADAFDTFSIYQTACIDATIFAERLAIAAESTGLGICYLGTTTYNPEEIIDILSLPRGVMPVTTLVIGYPDEQPGLTVRLDKQAVTHCETYQGQHDGDLERLYRPLVADPFLAQSTADSHAASVAALFTEVRYPREGNQLNSRKMLQALRRQGFLPDSDLEGLRQ